MLKPLLLLLVALLLSSPVVVPADASPAALSDRCEEQHPSPSSCTPPSYQCFLFSNFPPSDYAANGVYCSLPPPFPLSPSSSSSSSSPSSSWSLRLVRVASLNALRYEILPLSRLSHSSSPSVPELVGNNPTTPLSWVVLRVEKGPDGTWSPLPVFHAPGDEGGGEQVPTKRWSAITRRNAEGGAADEYSFDKERGVKDLVVEHVQLSEKHLRVLWALDMSLVSKSEEAEFLDPVLKLKAKCCEHYNPKPPTAVDPDVCSDLHYLLSASHLSESVGSISSALSFQSTLISCLVSSPPPPSSPRLHRSLLSSHYSSLARLHLLSSPPSLPGAHSALVAALSSAPQRPMRAALLAALSAVHVAMRQYADAKKAAAMARDELTRVVVSETAFVGLAPLLDGLLGAAYGSVRALVAEGRDEGAEWEEAKARWEAGGGEEGTENECGRGEVAVDGAGEGKGKKVCVKYEHFNTARGDDEKHNDEL